MYWTEPVEFGKTQEQYEIWAQTPSEKGWFKIHGADWPVDDEGYGHALKAASYYKSGDGSYHYTDVKLVRVSVHIEYVL